MGFRKVSNVKVGDLIQHAGRKGPVILKEPWPEGARADLHGYRLRIQAGDTQQGWVLPLETKVEVLASAS